VLECIYELKTTAVLQFRWQIWNSQSNT